MLAAVGVALVGALMLPWRQDLGILNVALIYLLACFALSLTIGAGPAILAAILSFVFYNLFFIPPYHTLTIARTEHALALVAYLGVAVVTAQLVARVHARTEQAQREQRRTALLYELNAALVRGVTLDQILGTIVERVVHLYGAEASRILLPDDDGELAVRARYPSASPVTIDRQDLSVAVWAMEHRQPAGRRIGGRRVRAPRGGHSVAAATPRIGGEVLYVPIATTERGIGVLEATGTPLGGRFEAEDERVLTSFADQAALALERARLTEEATRAAALAQSNELKSALLAAVSHDLRTPLATIKASATALLDPAVAWTAGERGDFLRAIDEETDRLTLLVGNLLDLSRIQAGVLEPDREWYDVGEAIEDVAERLRAWPSGHAIATDVAADLPLARFDYVQIAQVLTNLGENALRHTPSGTPVTFAARPVTGAIEVTVRDGGPGIAAKDLPHVFGPFYRAEAQRHVPGTGLGLAIAKGLVEAHGGRISAESRPGEGTAVYFTLPVDDPPDRAGRP